MVNLRTLPSFHLVVGFAKVHMLPTSVLMYAAGSVLTWTCVKDGACRCKGVYTSPERDDLLTLFTFLQQPNCCCLMYIHIFDISEAVQSASSSFFTYCRSFLLGNDLTTKCFIFYIFILILITFTSSSNVEMGGFSQKFFPEYLPFQGPS